MYKENILKVIARAKHHKYIIYFIFVHETHVYKKISINLTSISLTKILNISQTQIPERNIELVTGSVLRKPEFNIFN